MKSILTKSDAGNSVTVGGTIVMDNDQWILEWFGFQCVSPAQLKNALAECGGDPVTIHVNSPGGYVDAGKEMYSACMDYGGQITFQIDSCADSAASMLCMASAKRGSKCIMSPVGSMVIHLCSGGADGNKHDMEHAAEMMDSTDQAIANAYILKTGKSRDEVLKLMEAETEFTAQQALDNHLIDEIADFGIEHPENLQKMLAGETNLLNMYPRLSASTLNFLRNMVPQLQNPPQVPSAQQPKAAKPELNDAEFELLAAQLEIEKARF